MNAATDDVKCFFITGTGRCGSMLLARLFDLSEAAVCEHENRFRHQSMIDYHLQGDQSGFDHDIANDFEPRRLELEQEGKKFGVSSGHLYFSLPLLWEKYGNSARFILLVRRAEEFTRSAMARGFYDPEHPNYCIPLLPHPEDKIAPSWESDPVLKRNLWYWGLVNRFVLGEFDKLPADVYRVVCIEDFDLNAALDLCQFLGLTDVSPAAAKELLGHRINASPGQKDASEVNPYSLPITVPAVDEWEQWQQELLEQYTAELMDRLYPPDAI